MAKNNTTPKSVRCSFCGKAQESVRKIVAGPGVYICDECVDLCTSIIEAELYDDEKGYISNEAKYHDEQIYAYIDDVYFSLSYEQFLKNVLLFLD